MMIRVPFERWIAPESREMVQAAIREPGAFDERQRPQPRGAACQRFDPGVLQTTHIYLPAIQPMRHY